MTPPIRVTVDTNVAMAIAVLDTAVATAYAALRDLGLHADPAREAILAQVADAITDAAEALDDTPAADEDDDTGGIRTR